MTPRKVYVKAVCTISSGAPDPDFRQILNPMEARRLGRLLKRAFWTSVKALEQAGVAVPDAVITATDFGCMENSEAFLKALKGIGDEPMRPVHFMQSTHNTISSLIAIRLGCHGYNVTYSHKGASWESALLDAYTQISLCDIDTALVGYFDEKSALCPEDRAESMLLSSDADGALFELERPSICGN